MAKKKAAKKTAKKQTKAVAGKPDAIVKKKAEMKKVEIVGINKPGDKKTTYDVKIQTKRLGEAPHEYHFVLKGGDKLKNIKELAAALEGMGEDVYKHHVNDFKNDFAKWIEDVFNEKSLAEEIKKVENKVEAELKLLRHITKKLDM